MMWFISKATASLTTKLVIGVPFDKDRNA